MNEKKRFDWARYAPVGLDLGVEKGFFLGSLVVAQLASFSRFPTILLHTYDAIWMDKENKVLYPEIRIMTFGQMLDRSLTWFFLLAAAMLLFVAHHYAYHYQGSKSIYLMRRLPDGRELHRRCWTLPLLAAAASIGLALVNLAVYFALYMLVLPEAVRPGSLW